MATKQEQREPKTFAQEVQESEFLSAQDLPRSLSIDGLERIRMLNSQLAELITEIYSPLKFPDFTETIKEMQAPAREMLQTINSFADDSAKDIDSFTQSERLENLKQAAAHLSEALEQKRKEWEIIEPFLLEEIKKPEYNGMGIHQLEYDSMDTNGDTIKGSLWDKALTAAISAMEEQAGKIEKQLPSSFAHQKITEIKRTTDKISRAVAFDPFNLEQNGQMYFAEIGTGKKNAEPISVYCCINYKDGDTKPIGYVEKHLLEIAYSTARMQGGFVAWQDIYTNLGNKGRIKTDIREEWQKRFLKMRHADMIIHNKGEMGKSNYDYIEVNLPFFTSFPIRGKRKGQIIDGICINPEYKPPLFMFAENRKQITIVPIGVYQVPGFRLTEDNARLHDYLISEVAAMINSKITTRITYNTIYETLRINGRTDSDRQARSRTDKKIIKIFDAFKKCNWIADYNRTLSAKSDYCIDVKLKKVDAIEEKENAKP